MGVREITHLMGVDSQALELFGRFGVRSHAGPLADAPLEFILTGQALLEGEVNISVH